MAQTKKKRRRKHAGTQAGTVERRGRTGKGPSGSSSTARGAAARPNRLDKPPTWQGSAIRAAISAVLFAAAIILLFGQPPQQGLILGALMFLLYIPMSYYTDRFLYNRRQKKLAEARK